MSISPDIQEFPSVQDMYRPVAFDKNAPIDFTKEQFDNPDNEEEEEAKEWWKEQFKYLKNGYIAENKVWINPFYYFFLNYAKCDILNFETEESDIALPYYMDFQHEFADLVWFCQYKVTEIQSAKSNKEKKKIIKNAMNILLAKGRRKGLTTIICAFLIYLLLFAPGVKLGYGFPDDHTYKTFRAIFDTMMVNLPPMLRPNLVYPDNDAEIGNAYKNDNDDIVVINRLYWGNFGKSTGAFRGKKLFFVFFDEAGKFEKWSKVKGASKDCFKVGTRKLGFYILGGTSDAITNKGYKDYKDDVDKPHLSDGVRFLIYADQGLHPHIDYHTGRSIREIAREYQEAERAKLRKEGKSEDLRFLIQENPLSYDEFFLLPGGSVYDNELINDQIKWIINSGKDKDILRGELHWELDGFNKRTGNVYFKENKESGNWLVYKKAMPVPGKKNLFTASFDDVYKNEAPTSESMPAMVIYKDYDLTEEESDLVAAVYINPQKNRKNRYDDFLMGSIFWNAMTLGEINDEAMVNYYDTKGYIELLAIGTNGKYGYSGTAWDGKFKSQAEDLTVQYLEAGRHKRCYFIEVLQGLKDWGVRNTDVGVCFHGLMLFQYMRKTIVELEKIKKREVPLMLISQATRPSVIPRALSRYTKR